MKRYMTSQPLPAAELRRFMAHDRRLTSVWLRGRQDLQDLDREKRILFDCQDIPFFALREQLLEHEK